MAKQKAKLNIKTKLVARSRIKLPIKSKAPILKSADLPVTQGMLTAVHKQIRASINSSEKKLEAKINQVESKVELVLSEIHRMGVLMEEQNSRNRFVLDGYDSLYRRQDRVELRLDTHVQDIENLILKHIAPKEA